MRRFGSDLLHLSREAKHHFVFLFLLVAMDVLGRVFDIENFRFKGIGPVTEIHSLTTLRGVAINRASSLRFLRTSFLFFSRRRFCFSSSLFFLASCLIARSRAASSRRSWTSPWSGPASTYQASKEKGWEERCSAHLPDAAFLQLPLPMSKRPTSHRQNRISRPWNIHDRPDRPDLPGNILISVQ